MDRRNHLREYVVNTPTGFMCKFCSKEYDKQSVTRLICHLAKTESNDVNNCVLVPEGAQKRLQQAFNLSPRERTLISTSGVHLSATEIVGKQFQEHIDYIWSCLMDNDDHVFSIGIYGMGGVGKTTLAKCVYNKLLQVPNKFHHVFWVNVSPDWSIWNRDYVSPPHRVCDLQCCISKAVGVDLSDGDDEGKRAAQLLKGLAKKKKFLLILDDVWDYIPLQDVGIPVGVDRCTMVFTTRSSAVCKQLGCQRKIEVRCLPPDEGYELFKKNLGKETTLSREVEDISRSVTDKCAGLPLAISVMARNMKGVTDIHQWRNALRGYMQKKADMKIFQILKISYDYLNRTLQHCFLYCTLLVGGASVLAEYLVDEGIIKGMNSRREELDEAHTMVNFLGDVGLLEITSSRNVVKMHDLIRDMALHIMEENNQPAMIKNYMSLKDLPDEESWSGDLVRVSLVGNEIKNISHKYPSIFSNLSTLLLSRNFELGDIRDSIFEGMPGLKVLDLSHTGIESLPSSIYDLVNLTTLILSGCRNLRKILSVEKLEALKKLDLSYSAVEEVSGDISMLSKLTYLDLFFTMVKLEPRILAQLSHLQFLRLPFTTAVTGEELACLSRLETLNCSFYGLVELNKYLIHLKGGFKEREPPIQLDVKVGPGPIYHTGFANDLFYDDFDAEDDEDLSVLALNNCNNINEADMLIYFQEIAIVKCNEARSLCNFSPIKGATELKYLSIRDCDGLQFLCSSSSLTGGQGVLEKLEYMELFNLKNLSVLFRKEANLAYGSCFSNLMRFLIQGCPSIKQLFPFHLLPDLKNLQRLYVHDCLSMEVIFAAEEEEEESCMAENKKKFSLPKLSILHLANLPGLKRVCGERLTCVVSVSCSMRYENCPELTFDGGDNLRQ